MSRTGQGTVNFADPDVIRLFRQQDEESGTGGDRN